MMLWHNSILLLRCGPAAASRAYHLFPAREKATNNMMLGHNSILLLFCGPAASMPGTLTWLVPASAAHPR